jgi:hypothetical protein
MNEMVQGVDFIQLLWHKLTQHRNIMTTLGVKTERVFPGLSVLRKKNKMEVLSPEK